MSAIVQSNYSDTVCEQVQLQDKCIIPVKDKEAVSDYTKDLDHTAKDKDPVQDKESSLHLVHIKKRENFKITAVDNSPELVDSPTKDDNPVQDKSLDQLQTATGPKHTTQDKSHADHTVLNKETTTDDQLPDRAGQRDSNCITETRDPFCTECSLRRADPTPQQLLMCLHALSYTGPDWQFVAPPPSWAADDWVPF